MALGFPSILIRECRRLLARFGGSGRQAFSNGLTIALVAFGLPWYMGLEFLRSLVIIPLSCMGVFLVADMVADSFSGLRQPPDLREFLGRIAACVLVGWIGS